MWSRNAHGRPPWKRQTPPNGASLNPMLRPAHFHIGTFPLLKEMCYHFLSVSKGLGLERKASFQLLLCNSPAKGPPGGVGECVCVCGGVAGYPMAWRSSSRCTGMVSFPRKRLMIGRLLANLSLISISKTSVRSAKKEYF